MKNLVLCIILNFLFFVNIVYSVEIKSLTKRVAFKTSSAFNLTCDVSYEGESKPTIVWVKDSKNISDIEGLKSRHTQNWENGKNILTIEKAAEGDAGNYTCVAYQDNEEKARASILAETAKAIAVKIDSNINVVEEERLRIECKVVGEPTIYWKFENATYETSRDRVVLENYTDEKTGFVVRNGVFIIEKITMDDRGIITCIGEDYVTKQSYESQCQVRVKGKYAALWPFLGICAEVIVLCAIIVIYEKKRNKTELEESDTDQSPDQKNTTDHGKEANLRHRQ